MSDLAGTLRTAMADQDYAGARSLFDSNAAELENDIACRLAYAEALFRLDDAPAALSFLQETERRAPRDVRVPLDLGYVYFRRHDDAMALDWFRRAAGLSPSNMWPYYRMAQLYRRRGDPRSEVEVLRMAEERCHGRVSDEEYQAILKELASARSLLAVTEQPGYAQRLSPPAAQGDLLGECVHVTMAKDEGDVIYSCLSSSYAAGFRKFVIADNNSSDDTYAEMKRFATTHPDAITFIVNDLVTAYYQNVKTMALIAYAKTMFAGLGSPVTWAFPFDADEELQTFVPGATVRRLVDAAEAQHAKMIVSVWSHASSEQPLQRFDPGKELHESFPLRSTFGKSVVRKCAFRIDDVAVIEAGAHFVSHCADREADMLVAAEHGIAMVHYAVRSIEQSKRKTVNGHAALKAATGLKNIGGHWIADYEQYRQRGDSFFEEKVARYIDRVRSNAF